MRQFVFVMSHLGSGSQGLVDILNRQKLINITTDQHAFNTKLDLYTELSSYSLKSYASIYGKHILFNYQLSCKELYGICKFIYMIRSPKAALNEIISRYPEYKDTAFRYYAFRLRRICECARNTPGAVVLTWDNLNNGKGLDLIENYLDLKSPLKYEDGNFLDKSWENVPYPLLKEAEECYERHYFYLHHINLKHV